MMLCRFGKLNSKFVPKIHQLGKLQISKRFLTSGRKPDNVGHDWRGLLERATVSEVINKIPLVSVNSSDTIAQLQKTLRINGVHAALVLDPTRKPDMISGVADVLDWVFEMTRDMSEKASPEQLEKKGKEFFELTCGVLANQSGRDPYVKIANSESILKAVDMMEEVRRLVVCDSSLRAIGLVSQIDIVHYLLHHFDFWKSLLDMPLSSPEEKSAHVFTVKMNETCIKALKEMKKNKVTGLGVVNNEGEIVTNLSASDFLHLNEDNFPLLGFGVGDYLSGIYGFTRPPVYVKDGYDSYHTIMLKMVEYGVHRVYVLNKKKQPTRVVTLTDIMKVLANPENQTVMLPKKF